MAGILMLITVVLASSLANAATFSVTTNAESGPGSLRQAIIDANAFSNEDVITFNLPPEGRMIAIQNPLPKITNTVAIDATLQPGVKLFGPGAYTGFELDAIAVVLRGLGIERFEHGIRIRGGQSNRIEQCTLLGNYEGVLMEGGGSHEILDNVFSGNTIGIGDGFGSRGTNYIRGNLIGTDASGTRIVQGSEHGILGSGYSFLVIGGKNPGDGNVVSGNRSGIYVKSFGQKSCVIQGNFIGTDRLGTLNLGNLWGGVALIGGSNHVGGVEPGAGNTVAFNAMTGIAADREVWIQGNRVFSNGLLGISSSSTNYPVLSHASTSPSSTLIAGSYRGTPNTTYRIEFFGNDECDPSGFGEGQRFLGFTMAADDGTGRAPFAFSLDRALPVPSVVTATATSVNEGTSGFSPCQPVISPQSVDLSVRQTDSPDPADVFTNVTYRVTVTNAGPGRATNVVLENFLPRYLQFATLQIQPSQGTCSNSFDRVICSFGNLNSGASASVLITVSPLLEGLPVALPAGYYTNRAIVSAVNHDYAPANNVSEERTTVGVCDLGLTMTIPPGPFRAGVAFPLTVHVTNAGPSTAPEINVSVYSHPPHLTGPVMLTITNLKPATARDVSLSLAPMDSGWFWLSASIFTRFVMDPTTSNNFFGGQYNVQPGPGVLSIERGAYRIREDGEASIRVVRSGGSEGTLLASYVTSNETALANSDFIPVAGELIFGPSRTEAVITVRGIADEARECNEFLSVHLSSAVEGTIIASRSNAWITISERPPPLNGFVRPVTVRAANPRVLVGGDRSAALSADGRRIVFTTSAADIVDPPLAGFGNHVVMRDLETGLTVRLSPGFTNTPSTSVYHSAPALSGNGEVAAFSRSVSGENAELLVHDITSGSNVVASAGIGSQWFWPLTISSNGATVVFMDAGYNLYAFDVSSRSNYTVASSGPSGNQPTFYGLSDDGRFVLFATVAQLLPTDTNAERDLYRRDVLNGTSTLITMGTNGLAVGWYSYGAHLSADGQRVVFSATRTGFVAGINDWSYRIYVRDIPESTTWLMSTNLSPLSYSVGLSADGAAVLVQSHSGPEDPARLFLHDINTGTTTPLNNLGCSGRAVTHAALLSGNGQSVCFMSSDPDIIDGHFDPNDENIYRWDRRTGETTLISINKERTGGAIGYDSFAAFSFRGDVVAFTSDTTDSVSAESNRFYDNIFIWQAGALPRLSIVFSDGQVQLSWPSDSPPAVLETRTPESTWEAVAGPVQQVEDRYRYETSVDSPTRFFQLRLL